MKISKPKQELARIISENGGWKDQKAEWSAQDGSGGQVSFFKIKAPTYSKPEKEWMAFGDSVHCYRSRIEGCKVIKNFHQTTLSRAEYFHLYPAPDADGCIKRDENGIISIEYNKDKQEVVAPGELDADGWIEWKGGAARPVEFGVLVDVKLANGEVINRVPANSGAEWRHCWGDTNIIAYRLHKPEQAKPELCESVVRSIPEPDEQVWTNQPTIEQLAVDYINAKDYAERKQQEADDAKADADAKLKALEIAGEALGLLVSPITAKQEAELVITDWHDLQAGDVISVSGEWWEPDSEYTVDENNGSRDAQIRVGGYWAFIGECSFKFIRRP